MHEGYNAEQFLEDQRGAVKRGFSYAYGSALCSLGVGSGTFRHGATLVKRGVAVSSGFNSYKTHPLLVQKTQFPTLHAETHCLFKFGLDNAENGILFVLRLRPQGYIGLSKPCEVCEYFIREAGISTVFYTTDEGYEICHLNT